ncbi:hypothetical protein B0J13DRAFT_518385 [Dactylonectria estremocensis]|uniref:Zinc finger PHD-type domain-containing protein n=1 Tax=Dactylonectria estremocensis TaxID=1079267 RepID=A0A9P9FJ18_9HYPO|nr:hypothetical protein B0J13DRAFT_518385 [Dactylonectria estremocensis]
MVSATHEVIQAWSNGSLDHNGCIEVLTAEGSRPSSPATPTELPTPTRQTTYVSQFSTSTNLILKRMKLSSQGSKENSGSRTTPEGNNTLKLPMPASSATHQNVPVTPGPDPSNRDPLSASTKRKRDSPTGVDFTQNTIPFPWVGQPKSQPSDAQTQPEDAQSQRCSRCDEQSWTPGDALVACSQCLKPWHRRCHSPAITNETIKLLNFVCVTCTADQEQAVRLRGKTNSQRTDETERLRQKRLAVLPRGVVPAKSELVGFGAGRAHDSARNEYFSRMKKTDLLNILSLCDQLKPQLLVDMLVSVSKRHPDLPIFDSPDWEAELPSAQRLVKAPRMDEKPRHGHVLPNAKARLKAKATKKILKRTRVIEVVTDMPGLDDDVLPPTWAKADKGMYAELLLPDTEDTSLLLDENDEESFSHFLVDNLGKQIVEAVGG